jgi:hypothetical protein
MKQQLTAPFHDFAVSLLTQLTDCLRRTVSHVAFPVQYEAARREPQCVDSADRDEEGNGRRAHIVDGRRSLRRGQAVLQVPG